MKDLGQVDTYLGINIKYNNEEGEMTLDQSNYIQSLAKKCNIVEAKLYHTPIAEKLSLEPAQTASNNLEYRNIIEALLYKSTGSSIFS